MHTKKNAVVIGGGTGTFVVLSGLRNYPLNLFSIITMMDSGGSTGRLRDQYGVLPPGDIRQALVALSSSDHIWRKLFLYRYASGDLKGHNFGNLFLSALEQTTGSFEKALKLAERILQTKGAVIPVTLEKTHISARLNDGSIIKTEAIIDEKKQRPYIEKLYLDREVEPNPKALEAIKNADYIIIAPGDLYTSILPNFLFSKLVAAYQKSTAHKILILNLMNKKGQTQNFTAQDYLREYEKYVGPRPVDTILVNNTPAPPELTLYYQRFGEEQITDDLTATKQYAVYRGDFLNETIVKKENGDKLSRSLIRHDGEKLARFLWEHIINVETKI